MKAYTESQLRAYASQHADTIVIRTYNNGCSSDDRRDATEQEQHIIFSLILGALLAYTHRPETGIQSVADSAEFTAHHLIPDANAYDTIYTPIMDFAR